MTRIVFIIGVVCIIYITNIIVNRIYTREMAKKSDYKIHEYVSTPKIILWIGAAFTIFSLMIIIWISIEGGVPWYAYLLMSLLMISSICMIIQFLNWRIILKKEYFIYRTFFRKSYEFNYDDIEKCIITNKYIKIKVKNKWLYIDQLADEVEFFERKVITKKTNKKKDTNIIKMSKGTFIASVLLFILMLSLEISMLFSDEYVEWWIKLIPTLILICMITSILSFFNSYIALYDQKFVYRTPFKCVYTIKYSDVMKCRKIALFYIIKVKNKYFFINSEMESIEKFLDKIGYIKW